MVVCCSAANCKNRNNKGSPFSFHKFPLKNQDLLRKWISAVRRGNEWQPTKYSHVCSKHFEEKCFAKNNNNRCLVYQAVPTIFDENGTGSQRKKLARREPDSVRSIFSRADWDDELFSNKDYDEIRQRKRQLLKRRSVQPTLRVLRQKIVKTRRKQQQVTDVAPDSPDPEPFVPKSGADELAAYDPESSQHLVSLCEVYMPPSPDNVIACSEKQDESNDDETTLDEKVKLLEAQLSRLKSDVSFLADDQLFYLRHKPVRMTWTDETMRKATELMITCGRKGYNLLRSMGMPLPCDQTIKKRMIHITAKIDLV